LSALLVTKRVCGIGPVHRVDQQQHRVDHRQHALDLAAEVGVAGRIDDVDAVVLPFHRRRSWREW
jgi:hypothetical protein